MSQLERNHRLLTRTFNGHVLRSQGYSLEGCMTMVDRARSNRLISNVSIMGPGDEVVRRFAREHSSAPLVEVVP